MRCTALQVVDFTAWRALADQGGLSCVPSDFLAHCRSLREAHGAFGTVFGAATTSVLHNVFEGCAKLKRLEPAAAALCNVEVLGRNFALNCTSLPPSHVRDIVESLRSLTNHRASFGSSYMFRVAVVGGTAVEYLRLPPVASLGVKFAYSCRRLVEIDFSACGDTIEIVARDSFSGCVSLTALRFSKLSRLGEISYGVAQGCIALETVVIEDCPRLSVIRSGAFIQCPALRTFAFRGDVSELRSIESHFIRDSQRLECLDLRPLKNLATSFVPFLSECRYAVLPEGEGPSR